MKAWSVHNDYTGFSTIVFADTRGQAKSIAMNTEVGEDYSFTEIRVLRCKPMDDLYKGKCEADWYDPDTRVTLVQDCGWYCVEPFEEECKDCPASEWCEERLDGDTE